MAPVLVERKAWVRPRPANVTRRSSDLTPEEHGHVKEKADETFKGS